MIGQRVACVVMLVGVVLQVLCTVTTEMDPEVSLGWTIVVVGFETRLYCGRVLGRRQLVVNT